MVRAKFTVTEITRTPGYKTVTDDEGLKKSVPCEVQSITLAPVYSPDPESENGKFWAQSPNGKIELRTINMEAAGEFDLRDEFYVDFTKVPKAE